MKRTQPTRTLRRQIASALPLTIPLWAGSASATDFPIGVNFSENAAYLLGATETAGAPTFEHTNWNNRGRWGNPSILNDSTGTTTAVTLKWDATGLWNTNANETLGGNHKLMKGYLDSNGAAIAAAFDGVFGNSDDKPICLLTGLNTWMAAKGLTSYSVVIYSDGDTASGARGSLFWLAAADGTNPVNGDPGLGPDITSRVEVIDNSNWGTSPTFTQVTGTSGAGNFTVFSNLTAPSFYLRAEEAGTEKVRATINAIQIIGTDQVVILDTDSDGMPDFWESNYGLSPTDNGTTNVNNGPNGDPDGDTITNLQEYNQQFAGTRHSTSPINIDSDGDGLPDIDERDTHHTSGAKVDSDDDGLPDNWEITYLFDPLDNGTINVVSNAPGNAVNGANGDPDNDASPNSQEFTRKTDPRDADSDDDNISDGAETGTGTWTDANARGTNPLKADSDSDGLRDDLEVPSIAYSAGVSPGSDPNKTDSDGDGTTDRWEFLLGSDPSQAGSNQPTVAVANYSFELPTTATYIQGVPDSWSKADAPVLDDTFVENSASVGMTGGAGTQFVGIDQIGGSLYQDTGVPFTANTTYLVDIAGGYRNGYPTSIVEFGLYSSTSIGSELKTVPGKMNLNNTLPASGSPDADNALNRIRDASAISTVGFGTLAQAYTLVTGATPPAGNIVVYIRQKGGGRVLVDNVRIIAVPNSVDSDSDGLPDAWELANRLDPKSSAGDNGPNGDPDIDGYTNAQELASGSNPADINSVPAPPVVSASGFNGAAFEVTATGLFASKNYQLKRSAVLNNDFAPVGAPFTGASSHVFVDPAPPATQAFYRVEEVP